MACSAAAPVATAGRAADAAAMADTGAAEPVLSTPATHGATCGQSTSKRSRLRVTTPRSSSSARARRRGDETADAAAAEPGAAEAGARDGPAPGEVDGSGVMAHVLCAVQGVPGGGGGGAGVVGGSASAPVGAARLDTGELASRGPSGGAAAAPPPWVGDAAMASAATSETSASVGRCAEPRKISAMPKRSTSSAAAASAAASAAPSSSAPPVMRAEMLDESQPEKDAFLLDEGAGGEARGGGGGSSSASGMPSAASKEAGSMPRASRPSRASMK